MQYNSIVLHCIQFYCIACKCLCWRNVNEWADVKNVYDLQETCTAYSGNMAIDCQFAVQYHVKPCWGEHVKYPLQLQSKTGHVVTLGFERLGKMNGLHFRRVHRQIVFLEMLPYGCRTIYKLWTCTLFIDTQVWIKCSGSMWKIFLMCVYHRGSLQTFIKSDLCLCMFNKHQ